MQPIASHETYKRLLAANPWRTDLLPNASITVEALPVAPRPWHKRAIEATLRTSIGERLERWIFERKSAELRREAGANDEAVFDRTVCKGHFDRHRTRTTTSLADRIRTVDEASQ
jgi:hypothetical protein